MVVIPKPIRPRGAGLANEVLPINPQKISKKFKISKPAARSLSAGRGIIIVEIFAVYDLSRVKRKIFSAVPLDAP